MDINLQDAIDWSIERWTHPKYRGDTPNSLKKYQNLVFGVLSAAVLSGCAIEIVPTRWYDYDGNRGHDVRGNHYWNGYRKDDYSHRGGPAIIIISPENKPRYPYNTPPRFPPPPEWWHNLGPYHPPHNNPLHHWLRNKLKK